MGTLVIYKACRNAKKPKLHQQKVAEKIGEETGPSSTKSINIVLEGEENDVFWTLLGGIGPYKDEKVYGKFDGYRDHIPRLFHGSNSSTLKQHKRPIRIMG